MKTIYHPAAGRGHVAFDWLDTWHSFSFGQWHNAEKVHFGALRVLNDDSVAGGRGFGMHPHDNMEIVTIPLEGALAHKDSTGNSGIIRKGDVQIMSAGTGLQHSEYNASETDAAKLLQIWVFPKNRNIKPRYDQKTFDVQGRDGKWQTLVSPDTTESGLDINQDARFSLVDLKAGQKLAYDLKWENSGVYLYVIEGEVKAGDQTLSRRDAIGISETGSVNITASTNSEVLAIEVPMFA